MVSTAVNGVKLAGNDMKSLENGKQSPGNAVNTREIPGHFSSRTIKDLEAKAALLFRSFPANSGALRFRKIEF